MTTLVHDLLDLPEAVRKGDFVQGLTDGIANPEARCATTRSRPRSCSPSERALDRQERARRQPQPSRLPRRIVRLGQVALHGGARPDARRRPDAVATAELHALRASHPWIGKKKLVQLPIHMLDAQDMESKILGTYVRGWPSTHPDADRAGRVRR
jgi:hypothetical protein